MQEMQEMQVWSLGQEDPLEKEMATHSSILVWKTSWTEEPAGYSPQDRKESDSAEQQSTHAFSYYLLTLTCNSDTLTKLNYSLLKPEVKTISLVESKI